MTPIEKRIAIERKVVRRLIRVAKRHGYVLVRVWDGEENQVALSEQGWMDVVFSVDDCVMRFKHADETKTHCAVIVLGNDGWDCIADASMGGLWDAVMAEMNTYTDKLEETA